MSDHEHIDRQVAEMHRVIAARIRAGDANIVPHAKSNLARWRTQFGGSLPAAYEEWVELLDRDIEDILAVLEGTSQEAIRRRISSPFTGILSPTERWEILKRAS
jgi:hypothetical protein